MEIRQKTTEEVLADLEAAEEDVHNILAFATGTIESLAELPVCNEKKLNTLVESYLWHVRRVQETLKEHAHVLDISDQDTGVVASASAEGNSTSTATPISAASSSTSANSSSSSSEKEKEKNSGDKAENKLLRDKKLEIAARLALLAD